MSESYAVLQLGKIIEGYYRQQAMMEQQIKVLLDEKAYINEKIEYLTQPVKYIDPNFKFSRIKKPTIRKPKSAVSARNPAFHVDAQTLVIQILKKSNEYLTAEQITRLAVKKDNAGKLGEFSRVDYTNSSNFGDDWFCN